MPTAHLVLVAAAATASGFTRGGDGKPKHIVAILADDYGFADSGWHSSEPDVKTPNMNALVAQGIQLDRHYTHKYCSPTRSSIQSGRNPIHVNVQNLGPISLNPADPVSGMSGIPRNMTGLGEVMRRGGYKTHFVGKWDCGMATSRHTPRGRGYDTSLFYFHHMNDYWMSYYVGKTPADAPSAGITCQDQGNYTNPLAPVDLWTESAGYSGPARGLNGSQACRAEPAAPLNQFTNTCADNGDGSLCPPYPGFPDDQVKSCLYEDEVFLDFITDTITSHDKDEPLFLFWAPHVIHSPLQVPQAKLNEFSHVPDWRRRRYLAMVSYLDDMVGQVVDLLQSQGMYNDTLITFSSDNGGPVYENGTSGANNYPLRGGKASNWEGGVRVNGWVSGGLVPDAMRGSTLEGLSAVWDWMATFAGLAGIQNITDEAAAKAGLPPVDSVNLWPYWSGQQSESPRKELALASCTVPSGNFDQWCSTPEDVTSVGGYIVDMGGDQGLWKLIREPVLSMDGWQGPSFPNETSSSFENLKTNQCADKGCLFRIDTDPSEYHDLSSSHPDQLAALTKAMDEVQKTVFSPKRGKPATGQACSAAQAYGGFWGPFDV